MYVRWAIGREAGRSWYRHVLAKGDASWGGVGSLGARGTAGGPVKDGGGVEVAMCRFPWKRPWEYNWVVAFCRAASRRGPWDMRG